MYRYVSQYDFHRGLTVKGERVVVTFKGCEAIIKEDDLPAGVAPEDVHAVLEKEKDYGSLFAAVEGKGVKKDPSTKELEAQAEAAVKDKRKSRKVQTGPRSSKDAR